MQEQRDKAEATETAVSPSKPFYWVRLFLITAVAL